MTAVSQKKVLVMVLSSDEGRYSELTEAIRGTWGAARLPGLQIVYYYSLRSGFPEPKAGTAHLKEDVLICGGLGGVHGILERTLIMFQNVLSLFKFDYVFRCCGGSYVVPERLMRFIEDKPDRNFYCGIRGVSNGMPFASGSGYFLSRDLVELVARHSDEIRGYPDPGYHDDVAIGRFFHTQGIPLDGRATRQENDGSGKVLPDMYHVHIRTEPELMRRLHASVVPNGARAS